jgi:short-subunit dehydrogenase
VLDEAETDALVSEATQAEQLAMIDLNVRALTELSLAFIESIARRRGGTSPGHEAR